MGARSSQDARDAAAQSQHSAPVTARLAQAARKSRKALASGIPGKSHSLAADSTAGDAGGTFRFQATLPRLPIPPLETTCAEFLRAVEVLLPAEEMAETREAVSDLLENLGPEMQAELQAYGATQENYVDAFWDDAYLKFNVPVPVNVNPYFVLEDGPATTTHDQMLRATGLLWSTLKFAHSVRSERMAVDMVRDTPLCMSQYPKVLGSARIPLPGGDRIDLHPTASHVAVACGNHFYYFDAVAPDGTLLVSVEDVAAALAGIAHDAAASGSSGDAGTAVGAFTTDGREQWAANRALLAMESDNNGAALKVLDSALLVLCLDASAPADAAAAARNALRGSTPEECADDPAHAGGSASGTLWNRWYDKLQLIVCANGSAQVNFEHTPADGHSVLRFASDVFTDDVLRFAQEISGKKAVRGVLESVRFDRARASAGVGTGSRFHTEPRRLELDLSADARAALAAAQARFLADYVERFQLGCLEYTGFGKRLITSHKLSPDAFAQQMMMAAADRVTGAVPNTYESVMTKAFLRGRTEAGRPVTPEALAFVAALKAAAASAGAGSPEGDDSASAAAAALRKAAKAHSAMTQRCSAGMGVDRHLYALKCCWQLRRPEEPLPSFFSCPGYATLNTTVLSTSNCGNPALKLFGFGPVSDDGIGIGYIIKDRGLSFALCSKSMSVPDMIAALRQVLAETRAALETAARADKLRAAAEAAKQQQTSDADAASDAAAEARAKKPARKSSRLGRRLFTPHA